MFRCSLTNKICLPFYVHIKRGGERGELDPWQADSVLDLQR